MEDVLDRPREAGELVKLNIRFREELRAAIEAVAERNGNSMNTEIIARLEQSLEDDRTLGVGATRDLVEEIASKLRLAEANTGKPWHEDAGTYFAAKLLIADALKLARPLPPNFETVNALEAERIQLQDRRDELTRALTACGAIAENINTLLMLSSPERAPEWRAYRELPAEGWHQPDKPGGPLSDAEAELLRELLAEFYAVEERLRELLPEIHALLGPWARAQVQGRAIYEQLTGQMATIQPEPL